ncbi:MAG: cation-translocating P-type ATPase [Chitinophagales bacterium]
MQDHTETVQLEVHGMTCSNCALGITRFLENKGLKNVYVNFATNEVQFTQEDRVDMDEIVKGIGKLGYTVVHQEEHKHTNAEAHDHMHHDHAGSIERKFYISLLFTIPLLLSMIPALHVLHDPWIQLALCTPVYIIGFLHFGKSAWGSAKTGILNMDVLIFVGSTAAFFYSLFSFAEGFGHNYMFFETAASIITLVLLGNVLEHRSVQQTTTAIRDLSALQPEKAHRVFYDLLSNKETIDEVAVSALQKNDVVLIKSGDKIPADGVILQGDGTVDESMLTGESMPVEKSKGDAVTGATILISGNLRVQVSATSEHSVLAGIIDMVKKAQANKPGIQKLADQISAIFVPAVLLIAAATLLISMFVFHMTFTTALTHSIAVLVIACPCAMGLATPTAIMVGLGRSAKKGILIKGARTLETFAKTEIIVFDKTGTLTTGAFSVSGFQVYNGTEEDVIAIIHEMEKHSNHPLAKSLVSHFASDTSITFTYVMELEGFGMMAEDNSGNTYKIGSKKWMPDFSEAPHDIILSKNDTLLAGFSVSDTIKEDAKDVVAYFNAQGIKTMLLSGDSEKKCAEVAHAIGIREYTSAMMPGDKLDKISAMSKDHIVTMVGDGINDSPSLEAAHVGVSMSSASQIAINAAQIILLQGKLVYLQEAHRVSKATLQTIKQNLFWAFFYNVLAIPVAAIGLLNPIIAALSMAFSDVFVIGNSIRLKTRRIS